MAPQEQTLSLTAALAQSRPGPLPDERTAQNTPQQQTTYLGMYSTFYHVLPATVTSFLRTADTEGYSPMRVAAGLELLAGVAEDGNLYQESRESVVARRKRDFLDAPHSFINGSERVRFNDVLSTYAKHAEYVDPKTAADAYLQVMNVTHKHESGPVLVDALDHRLSELSKPLRDELRAVSMANSQIPPTTASILRYMAQKLE